MQRDVSVGAGRIELRLGDITAQDTDAIVNAANNHLILGSGVAGAIRTKGGPTIQAECDVIGPIPIGEAAITGAGLLPARHVIHAASMGDESVSERSLRDSTRNSLLRAAEAGLQSVSFPAIGTGIGGFPVDAAARLMLHEARVHLKEGTSVRTIRFVLWTESDYAAFDAALDALDR